MTALRVAISGFECPICGTKTGRGETYAVIDDLKVCVGCAYPQKTRRLRPIKKSNQ